MYLPNISEANPCSCMDGRWRATILHNPHMAAGWVAEFYRHSRTDPQIVFFIYINLKTIWNALRFACAIDRVALCLTNTDSCHFENQLLCCTRKRNCMKLDGLWDRSRNLEEELKRQGHYAECVYRNFFNALYYIDHLSN